MAADRVKPFEDSFKGIIDDENWLVEGCRRVGHNLGGAGHFDADLGDGGFDKPAVGVALGLAGGVFGVGQRRRHTNKDTTNIQISK